MAKCIQGTGAKGRLTVSTILGALRRCSLLPQLRLRRNKSVPLVRGVAVGTAGLHRPPAAPVRDPLCQPYMGATKKSSGGVFERTLVKLTNIKIDIRRKPEERHPQRMISIHRRSNRGSQRRAISGVDARLTPKKAAVTIPEEAELREGMLRALHTLNALSPSLGKKQQQQSRGGESPVRWVGTRVKHTAAAIPLIMKRPPLAVIRRPLTLAKKSRSEPFLQGKARGS